MLQRDCWKNNSERINSRVNFPVSGFVPNQGLDNDEMPTEYNLFAAICHKELRYKTSWHFTAQCKIKGSNGYWIEYNESLLLPLLVGCCVVVYRPLSSSRAVMWPSMLLLPAAFAANYHPLPPLPPPPLPLPLGRHCLHRHNCGQTHRHPLPKEEAIAAAPPAYQWQHQRENVFKSRWLGLI